MSRLKKNIAANYIGGIWTAIMGIAFVPLYIDYLGIEAYGLIGIYLALQACIVIIDMGFTPTLNREMARFDAGKNTALEVRQLLKTLELIYILIAGVFILLIGFNASWVALNWLVVENLSVDEVSSALTIMGSVVFLRWYSTLYRGALLGLQRQVWLNGNNIVFATLRGPGSLLALEFISPTITVFFLFQGFLFITECLILRARVDRILPQAGKVSVNLRSVSSISGFVMGVAAINILAMILTQLDKVVISALLPLSMLGYYTLAASVAGALYLLVAPVATAAYPRFTESFAKNDMIGLKATYRDMAQLMSAIVVPIACTISTYSNHLLLLWTQDPVLTDETASILSILVLGGMINGLLNLPYCLQLASGWTKLALIANLIAVLSYIPIVYFGVKNIGIVAPAVFWLFLNMCYVVFMIPLLHRRLLPGEARGWYFDALFMPLIATFCILLISSSIMPPPQLDNTAGIFVTLILTVLAAITCAIVATPLGRGWIHRYWILKL